MKYTMLFWVDESAETSCSADPGQGIGPVARGAPAA
jgi:hypothetical protein